MKFSLDLRIHCNVCNGCSVITISCETRVDGKDVWSFLSLEMPLCTSEIISELKRSGASERPPDGDG